MLRGHEAGAMTRVDRIKRDAQILELRATKARLDADIERRRVVEDYERSLVEVRLVAYSRKRARSEMHLRERVREADEHFRTIEAMLKAGLCE